jgi:prepilin-type N-terminal cleavage/methylation domain-containing protein/prepilin-type processing-associated H-X9-DG protein
MDRLFNHRRISWHRLVSWHSQVGWRNGVTLVELLVVLGIIGILAALIIPAIQVARESARVTACQSNLKQIGLAMQQFEATHKRFPEGGWGYQWVGYSDIGGLIGQPGAWPFSLLPYIEQNALYKSGIYQSAAAKREQDLRRRMETPVSVYHCPSRRVAQVYPIDPDCPSCGQPIGITGSITATARGDYAINMGDGAPDRRQIISWPLNFWGPADLKEAQQLTQRRLWPAAPKDFSGISYLRTSIRASHLRDGSSVTFMVGEKYIDPLHYESGKDWGDNEGLYSGFNNDNHRSTHPFWRYQRDVAGVMSPGSFGSAHAAGNFVFCDGSVRAVAYTIDQLTFSRLGNRRDGNAVEF